MNETDQGHTSPMTQSGSRRRLRYSKHVAGLEGIGAFDALGRRSSTADRTYSKDRLLDDNAPTSIARAERLRRLREGNEGSIEVKVDPDMVLSDTGRRSSHATSTKATANARRTLSLSQRSGSDARQTRLSGVVLKVMKYTLSLILVAALVHGAIFRRDLMACVYFLLFFVPLAWPIVTRTTGQVCYSRSYVNLVGLFSLSLCLSHTVFQILLGLKIIQVITIPFYSIIAFSHVYVWRRSIFLRAFDHTSQSA